MVNVQGVVMSREAAENVRECNVDVQDDVRKLRAGQWTQKSLLNLCLEGAEPDREQGWREYVVAVVTYVEKTS